MTDDNLVLLGTTGILAAFINISILCIVNRYSQWHGFESSMGMIIMVGLLSLIPFLNVPVFVIVLIHFITSDFKFPPSKLSAFLNSTPFSKKTFRN